MNKGQFCENCIHRIICDHENKYRKVCSQFLEQRPHGMWIFNKDGNYECSECGIAWKDMPVKDAKPVFKACPWCGTDMRKEGDEK